MESFAKAGKIRQNYEVIYKDADLGKIIPPTGIKF